MFPHQPTTELILYWLASAIGAGAVARYRQGTPRRQRRQPVEIVKQWQEAAFRIIDSWRYFQLQRPPRSSERQDGE